MPPKKSLKPPPAFVEYEYMGKKGQRTVKLTIFIFGFVFLLGCQEKQSDDSSVSDDTEIKTIETENSFDVPDELKDSIKEEQAIDPDQFLITNPTRYMNVDEFVATWNKAPQLKDYDVIVARDEKCKIPVQLDGDLTSEELPITRLLEGDYYFCLYAVQIGSGLLEAKNGPFLFTVDVTPPDDFAITQLTANNYTNDNTPLLAWGTVENANYFDLTIATDEECTDVLNTYVDLEVIEQQLPELEEGTYYACLRARDLAGNETLASNSPMSFVVDTAQPTVTSVSATSANGKYKVGSVISLTVNYDDVVEVTNTGDLKLQLETGTVDRLADYASGSGSATLVFDYTVQTGDLASDLDTKGAASMVLGTATIADRATNASVNTLPTSPASATLAGAKSLVVDGVVPTVTGVSSSTGDGYYNTNDIIQIEVDFSEIVVVATPSDVKLKLETGATDRQADYVSGSGSDTLVFSYTVTASDTSTDLATHSDGVVLGSGTIRDTAGNNANLDLLADPLSDNQDIIVDTDAPTPTPPAAPTDAGTYLGDTDIQFDWVASADSTTSVASYYVEIGTTPGGSETFAGDVGNVLTKSITGVHGSTYYARFKAIDVAGNQSAYSSNSNGIMVDTSAPSTPAAPADAGTHTNNTTVTFNWVAPSDSGSGIASYVLEIGTTAGNDDVFSGDVGNVLTKDVNGTNGSTYYARVKAIDHVGNESAFSPDSDGIVVDTDAPGAFSITGPTNPSYSGSVTVTFGASAGAATYDLIVSSVNDCNSPSHVAASPYTGLTGDQNLNLPDGGYYLCMTAKDEATNPTSASNNGYFFEVETSILYASYTYYDSVTPIYELRQVKLDSGFPAVTTVDDLVDEIKSRSSLTLDSADKVHISYQMFDGNFFDLYYAQNTSGSFAVELADGGANDDDIGFASSVALESDDTVHMAHRYYFDDGITPEERLTATSGVAGALATEGTPIEAAGGRTFVDQSIAVASNDVVHLIYTYFDGANYILGHRANNGSWGTGTDEAITNPSCDDTEYASLTLDSADKLHVAYSCVTAGGACKVFHATNATGSWVHTEVGVIDSAGCNSAQISDLHRPTIAADSSDKVHIAYFDDENGDLYYTENTTGSFSGVVVNASAGWEPTLALDGDDKAYIVYLSSGSGIGDLKLSTNNSGSWVHSTLDSSTKVIGVGDSAIAGVPGRSNR
ncbi:MAG: hypothetical protein AB7T49_06380 [Oligoflexales bacterium]